MKYGKLIFTKRDYELIYLILINWRQTKDLSEANYKRLMEELKKVEIYVDEKSFPQDVVKFGSFVDMDTPWGLLENYELVVPIQSDVKTKKLSVLTALGSAILGYAEGDEIVWDFPNGEEKIRIVKVNNPLILAHSD